MKRPLTVEDVGTSACDDVRAFCDAFARRVVERYVAGELPWNGADHMMNNLFALMTRYVGDRLPDFAWGVYLAFDDGEWVGDNHPGGDETTRPQLLALITSIS